MSNFEAKFMTVGEICALRLTRYPVISLHGHFAPRQIALFKKPSSRPLLNLQPQPLAHIHINISRHRESELHYHEI